MTRGGGVFPDLLPSHFMENLMSLALTETTIETYVRRSLGEPVIEVELTSEQIKEMITQALGIYGTHKPVEKFESVSAISLVQKYVRTSVQVGRGIIEVFRPDLLSTPITLDQFDVFKYHSHLPNLDPADFYMERMWWKEIRVSSGSDEDWEFFTDPTTGGGTLWISPPPTESFTLTYIYVVDPTLSEVPPTDDDWINDYTLAMCKEVLGRIRSKFTSVQGAETTLDMDGESLRQEGASDRQQMEEYLTGRGQIIAPIRG